MVIRSATAADTPALLDVHRAAFGAQGPEIAELVTALVVDPTAPPVLSLVAVDAAAAVVGHVLFTAVQLPEGNQSLPARILAPLAVSPAWQSQGVGGALVREGLHRLADGGVALVFVLGDPAYYTRHGFQPALAHGLRPPVTLPPEHEAGWMVQALGEHPLGSVCGVIRCADALSDPKHW